MEGHFEGTPYPLPATDEMVDTNAYDQAHQYSTAFAIFNDYWCADDFTLSCAAAVETLVFWEALVPNSGMGLQAAQTSHTPTSV